MPCTGSLLVAHYLPSMLHTCMIRTIKQLGSSQRQDKIPDLLVVLAMQLSTLSDSETNNCSHIRVYLILCLNTYFILINYKSDIYYTLYCALLSNPCTDPGAGQWDKCKCNNYLIRHHKQTELIPSYQAKRLNNAFTFSLLWIGERPWQTESWHVLQFYINTGLDKTNTCKPTVKDRSQNMGQLWECSFQKYFLK